MKTLHPAYRVTDLDASVRFYTAVGYQVLGRVELDEGATLTLLKFPDEPVATVELVHRPTAGVVQVGTGFSHLAVQVDDLTRVRDELGAAGLDPGPELQPGGPDGPKTSWLTDPDGYRIELVQWPRGHADGLSAADFP
jgi:lactoylglutathione lyase